MTDMNSEYTTLLGEAFGDGTAKVRLEAFVKAMRLRANIAAVDIAQCREVIDFGTMRGQISICNELAGGAEAALAGENPSANGGSSGDSDEKAY